MAGWEEEIHKMMKNKIMGEGMTPESRFRCPDTRIRQPVGG